MPWSRLNEQAILKFSLSMIMSALVMLAIARIERCVITLAGSGIPNKATRNNVIASPRSAAAAYIWQAEMQAESFVSL